MQYNPLVFALAPSDGRCTAAFVDPPPKGRKMMASLRSGWKPFVLVAAIWLSWPPAAARGEETLSVDGVVVSYTGVSAEYARAIGRTVAAARKVAVGQFGFDMPETITVSVTLSPQGSVRLFNDGQDRFSLTVRSEDDLRRPSASGIFHLYGLCHEVGHLAMYRPIRDHSWMTTAAAEGWAHYLGSRIVDAVFAQEGEELWPDRYDYREDGIRRLERQLASPHPDDVATGAGLWKELVEIVGDRGVAPIFEAWGKAKPDSADPGEALSKALLASRSDRRLAAWWKRAEGTFIFRRPKSDFAAGAIASDQLAGQPRELAHDDGREAGKKSIAGGGHAVGFEAPGDSWCATSVRIYGSRYGYPAPPQEDFHVWLCDEQFQEIADFPFPYSKFNRGPPGWVTLRIKPTRVPSKFIVCVGFNPTATKGVFVSRDGGGTGNSLSGLPGGRGSPFADGDWMIRVTVDQLQASAPSVRTWTDSSGKFQLQAEYVGLEGEKVRLRKSDGTVIAVPLERLSTADQQFIREKLR
jgi:hypothetical protein